MYFFIPEEILEALSEENLRTGKQAKKSAN
jgi:hypothetical protein